MERFSQCDNFILLVIISVVGRYLSMYMVLSFSTRSRLKDYCIFLTIAGRFTRLHQLGIVIIDSYEEDFRCNNTTLLAIVFPLRAGVNTSHITKSLFEKECTVLQGFCW